MRGWLPWIAGFALACAGPVPAPVPVPVPVWDQPPPPTSDAPIVQPGTLFRYELDNGLALIVLEDHRLPKVTIGLAVRRGAGTESLAEAGIARFTAETMERGAGDRDALALASAIDEIGGELNVSAGFDSMSAVVSGLSRDLDLLMEVLADVTLRPRFDAAEAERTRNELIAAMQRANDDPHHLEQKFAIAALYAGHRAGIPVDGTPDTIAPLTSADSRAFHARVFVPNNAVLFATGDIVADEFFERVGSVFGAWPAGEIPDAGPALPSPAPVARKIVVVDRPDLVQARITLIHEGIERSDPERIAASLLNSVIGGGGFSSRLMQRLRSDAGLTYGVHSGFSMRRGGGSFSVSTFTRVAEVRRAIDMVLSELERARTDPPTQPELDAARARAVGGFQLGLETPDALLGALVDLDIYGLPEDSVDTYRSRIRATTVDDLARLATALIHPHRAAIVLVGPASEITGQLEGLGPIEVVVPDGAVPGS